MRFRAFHFLALPLLALAAAAPAGAQSSEGTFSTPTWAVDAGLAGANALVAGTLVTVMRWARGEPLADAFRGGFGEGALAGVAAYGGKRVAAARFTGAGLVGRQLHGAAVSGTRSVAEGGGLTDDLSLFLGPLRLHLLRGPDSPRPLWSVSGLDLYWLGYGVADSRFTLDWGESLSAGAPVFRPDRGRRIRTPSGQSVSGAAAGGVLFLSDGLGEREPLVFAHERVHVLQFDFLQGVAAQPVERHLLGLLPGGKHIQNHLHPDLLLGSVGLLLGTRAESRRSPWEVEAHLLEGK
ncbi:MAG: hypothetical protein EA421_11425 [Gemmatimonadales bacterium]|nr:MAG: hypothetical protein EA421_11425 [Gemmatimonadales bacterium]